MIRATRKYLGLAVAGAAAYSMSTLFSAMKPVLLTRFVEQTGLAETLAGLLVAMPFAGIAAASLIMGPWLWRMPFSRIALLFGSLLVVCELLSAWLFGQFWLVLPVQFVSGICVGILMGTTSRLIAKTQNPDELFGMVDMTAVLLMSFMVTAVGNSVEHWGLSGGYLCAAVISVLFTAALFSLRTRGEQAQDQITAAPLQISLRPVAVIAMGMLFITFSGLGFAFMFTMAKNVGMSYDSAGNQIGVLLFVSAFACAAGGWCSARFGPVRPLLLAFFTCAVGWYGAVYATTPTLLLICLVPAIFALQFNVPILLALAGSLDKDGRWAAVGSPIITSGFAWAAIVAGQIVSYGGLDSLAPATASGMVVCALLLGVATLADKPTRQTSPGEADATH